MSEAYSVVVSGQLVEGFELGQVKENLIQAFKLSAAQVDKLLCGKPVALKRGIEKNVAVKLSQRLQDLGAVSIIKAAPAAKKAPVSEAPKAPAPQAASSKPAAPAVAVEQPSNEQPVSVDSGAGKQGISRLDCPRCGHSQPVSNTCQLCKMDLTLHLRRTERRARVVDNILKERQTKNT